MSSVFPGHIIRLEQTESTNSNMLERSARERLPEGTVVVASMQSEGRGQGNNVWESESHKNLLFTIILYPSSLKANRQFMLSKVVSLAVYDFISRHVADVRVKWPNDIYVGDRKITGILIENFVEGEYLNKTIAGIGININQEHFTSNAPNPVSLRQLTGKTYDLDVCLNEIIECISKRYQMLHSKGISVLNADYLEKLYRFGLLSRFSKDGHIFEATITGVNKYGMLEMTAGNEKMTFGFKEVAFV